VNAGRDEGYRDNSAAPLIHNLFRLIRQYLSGETQKLPILLCEASADFEAFQI
jgi:hypothetical protein